MVEQKNSAAVTAATLLLAVFFFLVGVSTILNPHVATGFPNWLRHMLGMLEITGAVLLLIRPFVWLGALLLAALMVGTLVALLWQQAYLPTAFPALFLISLASLAYHRFPRKTPAA